MRLLDIKLTLQQWSLITLVVIIGLLVVALKLQGSALHKIKLLLMEKELDLATQKDDENIKEKKARYEEEKRKLRE